MADREVDEMRRGNSENLGLVKQMVSTCWAFATLDAIELRHKMKTGEEIRFSVQQMIDFVWPEEKFKIGQGFKLVETLEYNKSEGITTEKIYPYLGCRQNITDRTMPQVFIS
ncbi:hypothetical protein Ddye_026236 [Dipteronia dyeriana]|uniref:Peptidase C1A papain C-terminal domain-containing protein n=1 Tax=Dipteronia dyeriana TaxID=168575 RepID=A0AAD9TLX5_9ROSI|nr:hypothetical protein Ddye_026236 [Dipteronia dyeriana]